MKYWVLGLIIVVLILIGGLFFSHSTPRKITTVTQPIFGQLAPSTTPQTQSPTDTVVVFYTWYINELQDLQTGSAEFKSALPQWLTPDFIANWQNIINNNDEDPIVLTQDYGASWASNINASVVSQTATNSVVLVSLGTGSDLQKLNVNLVEMNGSWLVSSVSKAP